MENRDPGHYRNQPPSAGSHDRSRRSNDRSHSPGHDRAGSRADDRAHSRSRNHSRSRSLSDSNDHCACRDRTRGDRTGGRLPTGRRGGSSRDSPSASPTAGDSHHYRGRSHEHGSPGRSRSWGRQGSKDHRSSPQGHGNGYGGRSHGRHSRDRSTSSRDSRSHRSHGHHESASRARRHSNGRSRSRSRSRSRDRHRHGRRHGRAHVEHRRRSDSTGTPGSYSHGRGYRHRHDGHHGHSRGSSSPKPHDRVRHGHGHESYSSSGHGDHAPHPQPAESAGIRGGAAVQGSSKPQSAVVGSGVVPTGSGAHEPRASSPAAASAAHQAQDQAVLAKAQELEPRLAQAGLVLRLPLAQPSAGVDTDKPTMLAQCLPEAKLQVIRLENVRGSVMKALDLVGGVWSVRALRAWVARFRHEDLGVDMARATLLGTSVTLDNIISRGSGAGSSSSTGVLTPAEYTACQQVSAAHHTGPAAAAQDTTGGGAAGSSPVLNVAGTQPTASAAQVAKPQAAPVTMPRMPAGKPTMGQADVPGQPEQAVGETHDEDDGQEDPGASHSSFNTGKVVSESCDPLPRSVVAQARQLALADLQTAVQDLRFDTSQHESVKAGPVVRGIETYYCPCGRWCYSNYTGSGPGVQHKSIHTGEAWYRAVIATKAHGHQHPTLYEGTCRMRYYIKCFNIHLHELLHGAAAGSAATNTAAGAAVRAPATSGVQATAADGKSRSASAGASAAPSTTGHAASQPAGRDCAAGGAAAGVTKFSTPHCVNCLKNVGRNAARATTRCSGVYDRDGRRHRHDLCAVHADNCYTCNGMVRDGGYRPAPGAGSAAAPTHTASHGQPEAASSPSSAAATAAAATDGPRASGASGVSNRQLCVGSGCQRLTNIQCGGVIHPSGVLMYHPVCNKHARKCQYCSRDVGKNRGYRYTKYSLMLRAAGDEAASAGAAAHGSGDTAGAGQGHSSPGLGLGLGISGSLQGRQRAHETHGQQDDAMEDDTMARDGGEQEDDAMDGAAVVYGHGAGQQAKGSASAGANVAHPKPASSDRSSKPVPTSKLCQTCVHNHNHNAPLATTTCTGTQGIKGPLVHRVCHRHVTNCHSCRPHKARLGSQAGQHNGAAAAPLDEPTAGNVTSASVAAHQPLAAGAHATGSSASDEEYDSRGVMIIKLDQDDDEDDDAEAMCQHGHGGHDEDMDSGQGLGQATGQDSDQHNNHQQQPDHANSTAYTGVASHAAAGPAPPPEGGSPSRANSSGTHRLGQGKPDKHASSHQTAPAQNTFPGGQQTCQPDSFSFSFDKGALTCRVCTAAGQVYRTDDDSEAMAHYLETHHTG